MFDVFTEEIEILIKDGVANLYWYRGDLNKAWHRVGVPEALCNKIYQLKDDTGAPLSKRRQMDMLYEHLRGDEFNLRLRVSRGFVRTLIEHKNFVPQSEKHRIEIAERAALKLRELIAAQESDKEQKERARREAATVRVPTYDEQLAQIRDSFEQARKMEPRPRGYALERIFVDLMRISTIQVEEPFSNKGEQLVSCPCAGINRHVGGNERVLQERSSEPS